MKQIPVWKQLAQDQTDPLQVVPREVLLPMKITSYMY